METCVKPSRGERVFGFVNVLFFMLFSATILFPFLNLLSVSLTHADSLNVSRLNIIPDPFSLQSYRLILADPRLWWGYLNTVFRTSAGTGSSLLVMLCAAYPLSKKRLPYRNVFTSLFVFTMFFGGGLIPTYLLVRGLGLVNNRLVFIIPPLVSVFSMLIIRNYLMSIPSELEESAYMDGANEIRILFSVLLPLSLPVLATVGLWTAVGHWNSWFDSLIYINDSSKHVVQIWLRRIVVESSDEFMQKIIGQLEREMGGYASSPETLRSAAIFVTVIPILAVYPFVQKYFVRGIMAGSLKG